MDMIIAVDTKRRITEFNRAAEETFGYVREKAIGKHISMLYEDGKYHRKIHDKTVEHGQYIQEVNNKRNNGEVFPVILAASVLLDLDGNEIGIVGVSRDITDQKHAEERLKLSEERHRAVVESANDAIITIDHVGNVIAWNISAQVMFGYLIEDIQKRSLQTIIPERFRKDHLKGLDRVTAGGGSNVIGQTVELVGLHKDGSEFPIEFSLTSWESAGEMYFTAIIRDITIKKQDQINLEQALEDAKQGAKIKSLFLANISHEIRTPLNSIIGYTDLLKEMLDDRVGADEKEFFEVIDRSGQRLIRTVHEILDMSQMDTQSYNLNIKEFDLSLVVQQAITELTPRINEKNLTVDFYSEIQNPILNADEYCITQAVSNIIDNAIKYTNEGGLTIWIDENIEHTILVIKDTGIGISKVYLKQVFEIFSQESAGYSRKYEGLGLGLALTKSYLEVNNAEINIDSIKGAGTKVTITFPKEETS
jgi:two-component system, sensor histidine kinase and response regulator